MPETPAELIAAWERTRNSQTLGTVLNVARVSRGLSLLQIQTATGINGTYLVKLEHNLVPQPSLFVLVQLCDALDLNLEFVLRHLSPGSYTRDELQALEQRWRLCLLAQPGNRNGMVMLQAIHLLQRQVAPGLR